MDDQRDTSVNRQLASDLHSGPLQAFFAAMLILDDEGEADLAAARHALGRGVEQLVEIIEELSESL